MAQSIYLKSVWISAAVLSQICTSIKVFFFQIHFTLHYSIYIIPFIVKFVLCVSIVVNEVDLKYCSRKPCWSSYQWMFLVKVICPFYFNLNKILIVLMHKFREKMHHLIDSKRRITFEHKSNNFSDFLKDGTFKALYFFCPTSFPKAEVKTHFSFRTRTYTEVSPNPFT